MKKIISVFLIMSMLLFCVGCTKKYDFMQDVSSIDSVKIVFYKYWDEIILEDNEEILFEVENVTEFITDFSELEFHSGAPEQSFPNPIAVKFEYKNGDFESVTIKGTYSNKFSDFGFSGAWCADETQFFNLINKYCDKKSIKHDYVFIKPEKKIKKIEIVEIGESIKYYNPEEKSVLYEIEDCGEFLEKFSKLDCYLNFSVPNSVQSNSIAIRITYPNDRVDIIGALGQTRGIWGFLRPGHFTFDEQQFSDLLQEYISKTTEGKQGMEYVK